MDNVQRYYFIVIFLILYHLNNMLVNLKGEKAYFISDASCDDGLDEIWFGILRLSEKIYDGVNKKWWWGRKKMKMIKYDFVILSRM